MVSRTTDRRSHPIHYKCQAKLFPSQPHELQHAALQVLRNNSSLRNRAGVLITKQNKNLLRSILETKNSQSYYKHYTVFQKKTLPFLLLNNYVRRQPSLMKTCHATSETTQCIYKMFIHNTC